MEPRIGVYICHCGSNIAATVDVEEVAKFAQGLDSVVIARAYKFMCSEPGKILINWDLIVLLLLLARRQCMNLHFDAPVRKPG